MKVILVPSPADMAVNLKRVTFRKKPLLSDRKQNVHTRRETTQTSHTQVM